MAGSKKRRKDNRGRILRTGESYVSEQSIYKYRFVYCRSGRRSKEASAKLAALGYTNIYEFGGILDWDGEKLFFNRWFEEGEGVDYKYWEETIVRDLNGNVIEILPGDVMMMPNGEMWHLK